MDPFILMAIVGAFLVGCNETINKRLAMEIPNKFLHIAGINFFSAIWTLLMICIFSLQTKVSLFELEWKFSSWFWIAFLLVAALNIVIRFCDFKSYEKGQLSQVIQIKGTTIVLLMFVGWLILGETYNFWGVVGLLLIFFGTWVLGIERDNPFSLKGPIVNLMKNTSIRYALVAAVVASITLTLEKLGVINVSPAGQGATMKILLLELSFAALCGTFVFKLFLGIIALGIAIPWQKRISRFEPQMELGKILWSIIVAGFFSASHQWFLFSAYIGSQAAYVGGVKRVSILFAVILAFIFFGEKQRVQKLISASIIVAGVLIISFLGS